MLSNETFLQSAVDPYVDGIATTAEYPDPKIFSFSAADDPGGWSWLKHSNFVLSYLTFFRKSRDMWE
jgi:hypothetical protein